MRRTCFAVLLTLACAGIATAQVATDDPSYPTAAVALNSLRAKAGVKMSVESGWTVIEDAGTLSVWSFPPSRHPTYPAAIQRRVVQEGSNVFIRMNVLCEAPKAACDAMVADFEELNGRVRQELQR